MFNPYPAEINNLNFHPLEVVSSYRDPQLQVLQMGENYWYLLSNGEGAELIVFYGTQLQQTLGAHPMSSKKLAQRRQRWVSTKPIVGQRLTPAQMTHQCTFHSLPLITGPVQSCAILTPWGAHIPAVFLWLHRCLHITMSGVIACHLYTWAKWSTWGWSVLLKDNTLLTLRSGRGEEKHDISQITKKW